MLACVVALGGAAATQTTAAPAIQAAGGAAVHFGRLVDVYGRRAGSSAVEPYRRDVLVGPAVTEVPEAGCTVLDANPDSGRRRILIEPAIGSAAFAAILQRIETADNLVAWR